MPTTLLLVPPDFQTFLWPCFVQNFNQFFNKGIFISPKKDMEGSTFLNEWV